MIEKHDLLHDLPEHRDRIHALKLGNAHFAKLFAAYHDTDHAVHRIETGAEAASDERLEGLKRERLHLKDALYAMILDEKIA